MKLLFENWRGYLLSESYILDEDFFEASIQQLFDKLKDFGDNTWIFFDTETTRFEPVADAQLTEIAAVAAYPNNWQFEEVEAEKGLFYDKIKLNPETIAGWEASDNPKAKEALGLTRYGMKGAEYREKYPKGMPDEVDVIKEFLVYVKNQPNPVLVAQNAEFDINFVETRANFHRTRILEELRLKELEREELPTDAIEDEIQHLEDTISVLGVNLRNYPIFDTMMLIKLWHNSLIKTLADEGDERAQTILQALTMTGKFGDYVSASMQPVSKAYEINTDDWHNALADVKMMMGMTRAIFTALQESADVDISKYQGRTAWGLRKKRQGYHRSDK